MHTQRTLQAQPLSSEKLVSDQPSGKPMEVGSKLAVSVREKDKRRERLLMLGKLSIKEGGTRRHTLLLPQKVSKPCNGHTTAEQVRTRRSCRPNLSNAPTPL